jgi:hypothetical protein
MRAALLTLAALAAAAPPSARAVSYLSIPTGEARMRVGRPEGDIMPVILQARTGGVASLLDIREHLVSYWDVVRHRSRGSDLQAYEVGDAHADSARFDPAGGKVTVVERRRGRPASEKVLDVPAGALDLTGAFVWLRLQDLEVGSRFEVPVVTGTSQFVLLAEVLAREVVTTPAGKFPSFKIKIRTGLDGKFAARRDSLLWLAEAAGHHLVRAAAEFAVGSVVAELTSYHPGGQVAAAE